MKKVFVHTATILKLVFVFLTELLFFNACSDLFYTASLKDESIIIMQATNFVSVLGDSDIALSWQNPTCPNFAKVVLVRKLENYPTTAHDATATILYEGTATS